jgi:hypothetical protein
VTADELVCPSCSSQVKPAQRFCSNCGTALSAAGDERAPTLPPDDSWDPVAYADIPRYGAPREVERTRTGLHFMIFGFAFVWIPYVSVLGGLLIIIGVVFLWLGRRAYGQVNRRFVVRGCTCVVLSLLLSFLAALVFVGAVVDSAATGGATVPGVGAALRSDLNALLISTLVTSTIGALGYVLLVYGLAGTPVRRLLWVGFGLSIALSVVTYAIVWPQISTAIAQATSGSTINVGPVNDLRVRLSLWGSLQFIPGVVFLYSYYRVRRGTFGSQGPSEHPPEIAAPFARTR